ncbi:hypothetical protein [Pseudoduganella sp.]|uniref:hypothetical protein n=1 Tax=Pseudoduganella sp. TaxID=1880898 RepID=UPI0035B04B80
MKNPVSPIAVELLTKELAHEVKEQRELLVLRLHTAFLQLGASLQLFRELWQEDGAIAYQVAAEQGWNPPPTKWLRFRRSVFDGDFWSGVADTLRQRGAAPQALQSAQPDEWCWWKEPLGGMPAVTGFKLLPGGRRDAAPHSFTHGAFGEGGAYAATLHAQRAAILALPALLASGDRAGIADFMARVLPAVWPDLAPAISAAQAPHVIEELLDEQDSMLTWLAYMELAFDAMPPSLYAYIAGVGGATLMLELRLLLPLLLLDTGSAVADAVSDLLERLECCLDEDTELLQPDQAVADLAELLLQLRRAASEVHEIGLLLADGRADELALPPPLRSNLAQRMAAIREDKSCRRCGSKDHSTPLQSVGSVSYE